MRGLHLVNQAVPLNSRASHHSDTGRRKRNKKKKKRKRRKEEAIQGKTVRRNRVWQEQTKKSSWAVLVRGPGSGSGLIFGSNRNIP